MATMRHYTSLSKRFNAIVSLPTSLTSNHCAVSPLIRQFSTAIPAYPTSNENHQHNNSPHCETCTCHPPPPPPRWSFYKRTLPSNLISFASPDGKDLLKSCMASKTAECYFPLMEQFLTQADPAFCGLTTLVMVLNALSIDPNVRWRGGWRWFDEDLLLRGCCLDKTTVQRVGITMDQFRMMGRCHGAKITSKRPSTEHTIQEFREDIKEMVQRTDGFLVTSFARSALNQTGEGHYSPIAAFHKPTDMVLILDVARFKYAPYWVHVQDLYDAMKLLDPDCGLPRGWFLVFPEERAPLTKRLSSDLLVLTNDQKEKKMTREIVDRVENCPVGEIKVTFCSVREKDKID